MFWVKRAACVLLRTRGFPWSFFLSLNPPLVSQSPDLSPVIYLQKKLCRCSLVRPEKLSIPLSFPSLSTKHGCVLFLRSFPFDGKFTSNFHSDYFTPPFSLFHFANFAFRHSPSLPPFGSRVNGNKNCVPRGNPDLRFLPCFPCVLSFRTRFRLERTLSTC